MSEPSIKEEIFKILKDKPYTIAFYFCVFLISYLAIGKNF